MSREKSATTTLPNSFNPPLTRQVKSPLPAINAQPTRQPHAEPAFASNHETDFALPAKVFKSKKTSVNDLSQAACSHLWFRRIKEIFLVMGKQNDAFTRFDMDLARADMIQTCEQYLESERPKGGTNLSSQDQDRLDRWKNKRLYAETFRMSYFRKETGVEDKSTKFTGLTAAELSGGEVPNFDNAIWWYSCNEAPIFDQMNNILRLENFELLMCHRYYMSDLCQMIERAYMQKKPTTKFTVYRADKMNKADFEVMKGSLDSKGKKDAMITINGFISTSRNQKIVWEYAKKKLGKPGSDVVVIYEIAIDPAVPCSAFADIQSISFHPREEEVLFNMGSTFQIDGIDDDVTDAGIKRIKLTARDFNLAQLDEMKAKVKQSSQATLSILLVRYLIELDEDRVSKRYLHQLIDSKQLENDPNLVSAYNCLGIIYARQALYGEALEYYRKALNTQARLQFSNNNALAEIFNYIGQAHLGLKQLDEAEQNLEEGIRIQKRERQLLQQHLASLYCNLGELDYARGRYDEAEKNFQRSDDLYKQNTKITHDALEKRLLKADLCVAIGRLKAVQNPKDPTAASEKFQEALKIYESTLPTSHPKVAETHIGIVCEYARNRNFQSVIKYHEEHLLPFLQEYETKQTSSEQELANLYAIIGACYAHAGNFDKAIENWKKNIEHEHKAFLDQLLSAARVTRVVLPVRLVDSAVCAALEQYSSRSDAPREDLAILYAKTFAYDEVVKCLRGKSSYLLAHTCISQRNLTGALVVYKRLLEEKNPDLALLVNVLLRMLTLKRSTSRDEPVTELVRTEKLLANRALDSEAIRLRMIILDSLADTYLSEKQHDEALRYSRLSFELKQRHYSANHPSLVHNCRLAAACSFQQGDFKTAAQYYERAIEIQQDNMPSGHPDIRSNYFLMADCYCQLNRTDLANEFYERAQATSENDADDDKTAEQDSLALIRMHSNLAKLYAEQKDFTSARSEQEESVDLLEKMLPAYVVTLLKDEDTSSTAFEQLRTLLNSRLGLPNGRTFGEVLHNYAFICHALARAALRANEETDDDKDATDVYEQAIELQLKLTLFEKKEATRLANLYEELSDAYVKLYTSMTSTVQENLENALEYNTDPRRQRALEYRLGNLCFEENEYVDADLHWKRVLEKIDDKDLTTKSIVEKLIEKNKDNLPNPDDDDDDSDEPAGGEAEIEEGGEEEEEGPAAEENNENQSRPQSNASNRPTSVTSHRTSSRRSQRPKSVRSERRQSTKSIRDKEKPDELAKAYLELEDHENALKYFKKYAAKLDETLKTSWPDVEIEDEHVPVIKFFHSLLVRAVNTTTPTLAKPEEIPQKDLWTNLLNAYKNIFELSLKLESSSNEIGKANQITFEICRNLYDIPEPLVTVNDLLFNHPAEKLQWKELLTLLPTDESYHMLMRVAAYYTAKEEHEEALHVYCALQKHGTATSAVNYGILKLFDDHLVSDEDYGENIRAVDFRSSNIPLADRILLCQLVIAFWEELEDEEAAAEVSKELVTLQNKPWVVDDLQATDCIGNVLAEMEDYPLAFLYWTELQNLYNEMLPEAIVTQLYAANCTFEQLLRATQEMNAELYQRIVALAEGYELLADYEKKDGYEDDASETFEKARVIRSRISLDRDTSARSQT